LPERRVGVYRRPTELKAGGTTIFKYDTKEAMRKKIEKGLIGRTMKKVKQKPEDPSAPEPVEKVPELPKEPEKEKSIVELLGTDLTF